MPTVSFLIPIYNVEDYLAECLDSAKNQTFEDIEVICINDGSTDGSRDIIERYVQSDPRFRVIDKPNSGYGASMNMGLAEAKGKYIAILESDDIYGHSSLEHLVSVAEANDAQVVKGDFWLYWSKPQPKRVQFGLVDDDMTGKVYDTRAGHPIYYRKPSIWSAIYRRDFLEENQIDFLETPGASYQDTSFSFKVWACASRVVFSTQPTLSYRQDNESSSVNSPKKAYCVCGEYSEMERFLKANPEKRAKLEGLKERMKYDSYMWNYERLSDDIRDDFLLYFRNEMADDIIAGDLDVSYFESWAIADLQLLLKSPEKFDQFRDKYASDNKLDVLRRYLNIGGVPLVMQMLKEKINRQLGGAGK
ncbi:MAG: glycosyltransferase family 2 protein [Coriobacteriales bacterium]